MQKALILFILLLFPIGVFAEKVDVVADVPSGTYHTPVYITLTPTQPLAKTFYSFKPDGYPGDAFLYTGAILLKHSTPFIYFSFVSTSNESKIKQNNYIFDYSSAIEFSADALPSSGKIDVVLINSGSESVNIGFWYVQSESETVTVPEGTIIAPGATYTVSLGYTGTSAIVLRSPDDDEKDILIPLLSSEQKEGILPKKKSITIKTVPRKIISTAETTSEIVNPVMDAAIPVVSSPQTIPSPEEGSSPVGTSVSKTPTAPLDINNIVKVSATESGQKNTNSLYLVALLVFSLWIGGFQWFLKRKQK